MEGPKQERIVTIYFRTLKVIEKMIEWVSAIGFFGIVACTILQVFFRYVLNSPLLWTEELARYCGIFVIMLASSIALKHNQHIGIDFFVSKLPPSTKRPLRIFYSVVTIGVMGYLTYYMIVLLSKMFLTPTPAMRIPIGIPYLAMTFGCAMCVLLALCVLIEEVFRLKEPETATEDAK